MSLKLFELVENHSNSRAFDNSADFDIKFHLTAREMLKRIPGVRHVIMSELETGMLLQKISKYHDASLDLNKISNVTAHICAIQNSELGFNETDCDDNSLNLSINEYKLFKIISKKQNNKVVSVITDKSTQIGLIRMVLRKIEE